MQTILHIGVEKTGTTSIQSFLSTNHDQLVASHILYPRDLCLQNQLCLPACAIGIPDHDEITRQVHRFIARFGYSEISDYMRHTLTRQIEKFNPDVMILSNEHLHSRVRKISQMRALLEVLRELSTTVKVIVYIRRQDRLALSVHSSNFKYGRMYMSSPLPPVVFDTRYYYDYRKILSGWEEAAGSGNVIVRIFDRREFAAGDVVPDFFQALGLQVNVPPSDARLNESITGDAQYFLVAVNRVLSSSGLDAAQVNDLRRRIVAFLETTYGGTGISVSRREAEEFARAFSESNEYVRKRFFPERKTLFADNFDEYDEEYLFRPDPRTIAEMAARFLVGASRQT